MKIVCFSFMFIDYTVQLANALSQKASVMLVLPKGIEADELVPIAGGVDLRLFGQGRVHPYNPSYALAFLRVARLIQGFKPDVIHVQGAFHPWFGFAAPFLKRYPLVSTFHDVKPHPGEESRSQAFHEWCARRVSDQIIVHGHKLRAQMIAEYQIPESRVNAVHIGEHQVAPFKKYERQDVNEDGNLVLFFGRIHKYKGLEYLIKAQPLINKEVPNARIVIAGTGEDFAKYENMMGDARANFIVHNYRIPYNEGAALFQRCSVVVMPYTEASQSGVIPTAYGFRKPVVVTDVGSVPEIVDDGKTGFIVPSKDPEALAKAIVRLLKDDRLRREMGESAFTKLKTDFSWDQIADVTIGVYQKAIEARR